MTRAPIGALVISISPAALAGFYAATLADFCSAVDNHAPSRRSLPSQSDPLGHCYASDMDDQIEVSGPNWWVHGHIHSSRQYRIGSTEVLCNPLGRKKEETGFNPDAVIDLMRI